MSQSFQSNKSFTVIGFSPIVRFFVLIIPPLLGIVLGYFTPAIAEWATHLPWFPLQGPLKLITTFQEKWVVIATTVLGFIAGIWFTAAVIRDSLVVAVSEDEVQLKIKGTVQTLSKAIIGSVFIDGKKLVLLGNLGQELARESYESSPADMSHVFIQYGYPWSPEGDPYDADYRLWVPETPELPPALNALLKARELALQKQEAESVKELHREASKLGLVVRDKGTFQYWRNIGKS